MLMRGHIRQNPVSNSTSRTCLFYYFPPNSLLEILKHKLKNIHTNWTEYKLGIKTENTRLISSVICTADVIGLELCKDDNRVKTFVK